MNSMKNMKRLVMRVTAIVLAVALTILVLPTSTSLSADTNFYLVDLPESGASITPETEGEYQAEEAPDYGEGDTDDEYADDNYAIDNDTEDDEYANDDADDDNDDNDEDAYDNDDKEDNEDNDLEGTPGENPVEAYPPVLPELVVPGEPIGIMPFNSTPLTAGGAISTDRTVAANIAGNITIQPGGILRLYGDFTLSGNITIQAGGRFYMTNGRTTGFINVNQPGSHFEMSGGVATHYSGAAPVIAVHPGATFVMHSGLVHRYHVTNTLGGSGVSAVNVTGGHFDMFGGEVRATIGTQSVMVQNNGTFHMHGSPAIGGHITGLGSRGVNINAGIFTMEGGIIYGNSSDSNLGGNGVRVNGSGSTFILDGGTIRNNVSDFNTGDGSPGGGVTVVAGATFTMYDGLIEGNVATSAGGGVSLSGTTFTMHGGTIRDNRAETISAGNNDTGGGGVRLTSGATFIMYGGEISDNRAEGRFGGGVSIGHGTFTMHDGTIEGNRARRGGGISLGGSPGGAATVTMNDGNILGNTAQDNEDGGIGGGIVLMGLATVTQAGGTIANNHANSSGGGVALDADTARYHMTGGEISNNTASGDLRPTPIQTFGGSGVFIHGASQFHMSGYASIHSNHSVSSTLSPTAAHHGGGVLISGTSFLPSLEDHVTLSISDHATITGNHSSHSGGGIFTHDRANIIMTDQARIDDNHTNQSGGGVSFSGNTILHMYNITDIYNNTANQSGGGVHLAGSATINMHHNTIIHNNTAATGGGATLTNSSIINMPDNTRIYNNHANQNGGGVNLSGNSILTLYDNAEIYDNTANTSGGGAHLAGSAILNMHHDTIIHNNGTIGATSTGGGATLLNNAILNMHDNTEIYNNTAVSNGGGVHLSGAAILNMYDQTIIHHNATTTATVTATTGQGGGAFIGGNSTATIHMHDQTQIINNTAVNHGGGVMVAGGTVGTPSTTRLIMRDEATISGNHALHGGGVAAIGFVSPSTEYPYLVTPRVAMHDNAVIYNNTATTGGGAFIGGNSTASIRMYDESQIANNTATTAGGGVIVAGGTTGTNANTSLVMNDNTAITGNTAVTLNAEGIPLGNVGRGGGVALEGIGTTHLVMNDYATISNNTAHLNGGGIFVGGTTGSHFTANHNATIHNNTATTGHGGGIWTRNTTATNIIIGDNVSITNNSAAGDGGGIWSGNHHYSRTLRLTAYQNLSIGEYVVFSGNTAGGGAFLTPYNWDITDIGFYELSTLVDPHPIAPPSGLTYDPHPLNNYDINFRRGIIVDADQDRSTNVEDGPNNGNYNITGNTPNAQGPIIVTFPEGTDPEDIAVYPPDEDWTVEFEENPNGSISVIMTPPVEVPPVTTEPPTTTQPPTTTEPPTTTQPPTTTTQPPTTTTQPPDETTTQPPNNTTTQPPTTTIPDPTEPNETTDPEEPSDSAPVWPPVLRPDQNNPDIIGDIPQNGPRPTEPVERPDIVIPFNPIHHAYVIGFTDGLVRPHAHVTRAETATIFFRLITDNYRAQVWSQENTFPDVNINDWYNNAISTMTNAGLFTGMPNGYFEPQRAITRGEFALLISRFFTHVPAVSTSLFTDIDGHFAQEAINAVTAMGLITGYPDGTFRPNEPITRAEAAALINRTLGRLPLTTADLLDGMVTFPDNQSTTAWYYLYIQEAANSAYFILHDNNINKRWTQLIDPRDWSILERPDSRPLGGLPPRIMFD